MIETSEDVLGAIDDLSTRHTTPTTREVSDWVTGKRALRGEIDRGPAPWFGLEPVFRGLAAEGLIDIDDSTGSARPWASAGTTPNLEVPRVRLTDEGRRTLAG